MEKKSQKEFGLSSWAINNPTVIWLLIAMVLILGIQGYFAMPREDYPEVKETKIYISSVYPGNTAEDIERLITEPLEDKLKNISGVSEIVSTSQEDYSIITVEFEEGDILGKSISVQEAEQKVKDEVDTETANEDWPTFNGAKVEPNVFDLKMSEEIPIMNINIRGDYTVRELKEFAEYLQDEIESMTEIQEAEIRGALEREILIEADPYKMESMRVAFSDVQNAIAAENVTISGGNLKAGEFRRSLRVMGEFEDISQIEDVVIKNENNDIVYVRDVAQVKDTYEERSSYARSNQNPVVTLDVIKRNGANVIEASDKIKEEIAQAQKVRFPADLEVVISNDQSKYTRLQLNNLENSIISGVILVVLVLAFFMNLRNALFVGIAIPMSMFMSFMLLNFFGISINLMVLFSLILALGMLVDNGIVVVENIYRLMEEGYSPVRAAKEGVGEVAMPIITSTATTLAAFLPLAFWSGLIGEFMRFLPITLIIVLSSSLFVALVINPVLTALFMKLKSNPDRKKRLRLLMVAGGIVALAIVFYFTGNIVVGNLLMLAALLIPFNLYLLSPSIDWFQNVLLTRLEKIYTSTVGFALKGFMPYLLFFGTFGLLVFSIMLVVWKSPKVEFFPNSDPDYINIFVERPIGTDIETTNDLTENVEDKVFATLEPYDYMVESVISQVGEGASDPTQGPSPGNTPHKSKITVSFIDYQLRQGVSTTNLMEDIREAIGEYPGAQVSVDKNPVGPPVGKPVNIEVKGQNYEKLIQVVDRIRTNIENANIRGIEELKSDLETGKPELIVDIDREKARRFGLSTSSIATELRTALFGNEISKFKDGEDDFPINLRLQDEYRYDVNALLNQKISFRDKLGNKKQIPISSVADVRYSSTYGSIKRKESDRVITVFSNVLDGYNATEINQQIKDVIEEMELPSGYEVSFTGEQQEQEESGQFLIRALLIAVMTIFLIIVAQFNSVTTPFIILASVLLSTIGVFLGLVIFDMNFVVIMTGIGIISLAGVVVNNAIVLIDYTNLIRERRRTELGIADDEVLPYKEIVSSIIEGGRVRLRPVLLTAITTVLGLIPLAVGLNINFYTLLSDFDPQIYYGGFNADFWGPMAWTVIFGLVFATFLTLVIVPVMYLLVDKVKLKAFKPKVGEEKPPRSRQDEKQEKLALTEQ